MLPTSLVDPGSRGWLMALAASGALGAGIVGYFLVSQPSVGLKTPGRAAGSLVGLAIWIGLTALASTRLAGGPRLAVATVVVAAVAAVGSVGLAAIHVAAHASGWETLAVAALGVIALGLALNLARV